MRPEAEHPDVAFKALLRVRVEGDLPAHIRDAARRKRVKPSEYVRGAVRAQLERDGIKLADATAEH